MTMPGDHNPLHDDGFCRSPGSVEARRRRLENHLLRRDVEAVFDREADIVARARVEHAAAADPALADEIERTRRVIARLAEVPPAPDLSGRILRELHSQTPFLDRRGRRRVRAGRVAVAGLALALVGGVVASYRIWPGWSLVPDQAPIGAVVDSARADATTGVSNLVSALDSINGLFATNETLAAARSPFVYDESRSGRLSMGSLTLGDLNRRPVNFDHSMPRTSSPSGGFSASSFRVADSDAGEQVRGPRGLAWSINPEAFERSRPVAKRVQVPFDPVRAGEFGLLWGPEEDPEDVPWSLPPAPPAGPGAH